MPKHGKQILAEALKLPPAERAELVENLLASFEFQSGKKIDALWAEKVEDRIDELSRIQECNIIKIRTIEMSLEIEEKQAP